MGLIIAVMNEVAGRERRVALVPEALIKLEKKIPGVEVLIEKGAGLSAGFTDAAYAAAGGKIVAKWGKEAADVVLRVAISGNNRQLPARKGGVVVTLTPGPDSWEGLSKHGRVLALEKLPRTSRAQAMDVLSSQANLGGYAAVLAAAGRLPRLMPMLMTAAGSAKPAKVLVLGVGVAGLQAIATARRLGAQVSAFDVRPEVGEQIKSLGAKVVELEVGQGVPGQGGYAGAMDEAGLAHLQALLAPHVAEADIVICTAQVPGKPAPVLVSADAVHGMRAGSVVVDMAAGGFNKAHGIAGGNCPLSVADEVVESENGVTLLGETNWPATLAGDASRFWAQNMVNLLGIMVKDGVLDFTDELVAAMDVTKRKAE